MKIVKWMAAMWIIAMLHACGGGGGSAGTSSFGTGGTGGTTTPTTTTPTITLTLSATTASSTSPVTITAKLLDASGVAVANTVVSFSSTLGLGTFSPTTALTDSTGTATTLLSPTASTNAGADTIVATATVSAAAVTASTGFQSAGSTASTSPTIAMSLSTTTVTAAGPATVSVQVLDGASKPVPSSVVTFSTLLGLGTFNVTTALTDATGTASVVLSPAASTTAGADTVVAKATVGGTDVTASQGFQLTATNVTVASFVSSIGSGKLSAYGQAGLTLTLGNAPSGVPVTVSISSTCVTAGKATITPASVTTTNGTANFTFKDGGCGATNPADSVLATVGASSASASVAIALTSPLANSLQFVSATPSTIYLKGSGYGESSTVIFKVVDLSSNALPNQSVALDLTSRAGGLTLDGLSTAVTKTSDANGLVSVIVNSGTVPTPVRVQASMTLTSPATTISTVSNELAVAVGLPSELGFSLSQQTINIEGFNIDGTTNTYNIIASDRMQNPVPVGTAINFIAEAGGQVEAIKQIALSNGLARATANFVSADPRPADGRITVVAYALGEESFLDANGNNTYDAGEDFQDLGDIYVDRTFDGTYDAANDQLVSLSLGGHSACVAATSPTLALSRAIPTAPATCDSAWGKAYVRKATETVLSTSSARPVWGTIRPQSISAAGCSAKISLIGDDLAAHSYYTVGTGGVAVSSTSKTGSFGFLVSDANSVRLNPMAAGTTVTASATTGLTVTINGGASMTVPNTASAPAVGVGYAFDSSTPSGTITFQIKSPGGLISVVSLDVSQITGVTCP